MRAWRSRWFACDVMPYTMHWGNSTFYHYIGTIYGNKCLCSCSPVVCSISALSYHLAIVPHSSLEWWRVQGRKVPEKIFFFTREIATFSSFSFLYLQLCWNIDWASSCIKNYSLMLAKMKEKKMSRTIKLQMNYDGKIFVNKKKIIFLCLVHSLSQLLRSRIFSLYLYPYLSFIKSHQQFMAHQDADFFHIPHLSSHWNISHLVGDYFKSI